MNRACGPKIRPSNRLKLYIFQNQGGMDCQGRERQQSKRVEGANGHLRGERSRDRVRGRGWGTALCNNTAAKQWHGVILSYDARNEPQPPKSPK